jgi:penicillin-binding protein 1C
MPTPGLYVARDPRIPDSLEALTFEIESPRPISAVRWIVDGVQVGETGEGIQKYLWSPQHGRHTVEARVRLEDKVEWSISQSVVVWVR